MTKAADLSKTGSFVNTSGQLSLTTGVTGILPVANGGTGTSTGVAPGGSTTQVQYNNAGAFGGDSGFVYSSGNVGIGTSSPVSSLTVNGNANLASGGFLAFSASAPSASNFSLFGNGSTTVLNGPSAGVLQFNIANSEKMRLDSSGNLGLGVTPSAWSTGKALELGAVGSGILGLSGETDITENAYYNAGWKYAASSLATAMYSVSQGKHIWFNAPSGTAGNAITFTQAMTLDASGYLGIGITAPTYRLHSKATNSDSISGIFETSVSGGAFISFKDTGTSQPYNVRVGSVGEALAFQTSSTERMRIDSSGNVLIGTTSGSAKFWATTGDATYPSRVIVGYGTGAASTKDNYYSAGRNHIFEAGDAERARISAAGGFSVGTTADPGAGAIYATGAITAYYSDDRLKTKLGGIENALDKVKSLSGFYYEANQTAQDLGYQAVREVGVSAQQVQAVLPEVVKPAPIDQKYLTVDYERLVPLLIEAIKELEAQVAELKAKQ